MFKLTNTSPTYTVVVAGSSVRRAAVTIRATVGRSWVVTTVVSNHMAEVTTADRAM